MRCIYCGTLAQPLTDEHIIPFGLGGRLILPKASCNKCADVTSGPERYCQKVLFGEERVHLGLPSRRKSKQPTSFAVGVNYDGHHRKRTLKIPDHPFVMQSFTVDSPGIFRGAALDGPVTGFRVWIANVQLDIADRIRRLGVNEIETERLIKPHLFLQMLAKIAHSYTSAVLPDETYTPTLPPLIVGGRVEECPYFVGGSDIPAESFSDGRSLHEIKLLPRRDGLVVVGIQLFAMRSAPVYEVVSGQSKS